MKRVTIASIVEGEGDVAAVPILLQRLLKECFPAAFWPNLPEPIRISRSSVVKPNELERYVALAAGKVERPGAILVLLDADKDCPATLGPQLLRRAQTARSDMPIAVVLANKEYESWFLAAAESLRGRQGLSATLEPHANPETKRGAKEWLIERMEGSRTYRETVDQPELTRHFNLQAARACPSFDKLHRDITRLLAELAPSAADAENASAPPDALPEAE